MSEAGRRAAAEAAAALVRSGMLVGLGTGRAAALVLEALGRRIVLERMKIAGVPTSEATAARAAALGIPLAGLGAAPDLAIDGADEIERGTLRLLKGGGGALLREKIVAAASTRFVVVAEAGKLVDALGATWPLPVEVEPFGHEATARRIAALGGVPRLRPARSDGGHLLYDCAFGPLRDPFTLERRLRAIPGVIATGLFLSPPDRVLIGAEDGSVQVLHGR
jgi:ribose 5-phosphate isomerase A